MDILLNWICQGACVAAAAAVLLRIFGRPAPRTRYAVWWGALLLVLVLPAGRALTRPGWFAGLPTDRVERLVPVVTVPATPWISDTLLLALLFSWICVSSIRAASSALTIRRAKRASRPWNPSTEATLACWSSLAGSGRPVSLRLSEHVRSAAVLGVGSPVIAVAPPLLTALSRGDLDRVIAHEWAHVQRYDDVTNALQVGIRAIAGWHPAIWWIDRQLHMERELACDERAIRLTGAIKPYAACLATLASLRLTPAQTPLPVPGMIASSGIRRRVTRILELPRVSSPRWSTAAGAVVMCLVSMLAAAVSSVDAVTIAAGDVAAVLRSRSLTTASLVAAAPARSIVGQPGTGPVSRARPARHEPARSGDPDASAPPSLLISEDLVSVAAPSLLADMENHAAPVPTQTAPSVPPALDIRDNSATDSLPSQEMRLPSARLAAATDSSSDLIPLGAAPPTPWNAAADAGMAIGHGSQRAATATAGFFGRLGKRVANSF